MERGENQHVGLRGLGGSHGKLESLAGVELSGWRGVV
jgi:hypothetical protein